MTGKTKGGSQTSLKPKLGSLIEFLFRDDAETTKIKEQSVLRAYRCVASPGPHELLHAAFEARTASKV